ncbi:MAG TPA: tetratricopeptide repeat protein [Longimicrobiaceae bacterium]|nr:tetratricopeptide repeat protein [Longimicrobiaceae bacterium]
MNSPFRTRLPLLLAALALGAPLPVAAQAEPPRPALPRDADPNDWTAYYDHGVAVFKTSPGQADAAFYWASRVDPSRAEPLFGRWATFWMRDYERWIDYLRGSRRVRESPEVARADTLLYRAAVRNPFVHRGLEALLYDRMPGRWRDDIQTRAWLAYATGDLPRAAELFGRVVERNPERNRWARYDRALALVAMGRFGEAATEVGRLLESLRREDEKELVRVYASKEMLEYATGLLHSAQNDDRAAREAHQRALLENLGFSPARAALGRIALAERRFPEAVREYEQAVEIDGRDAVVRFHYATALQATGEVAEAERELRVVVEREPYYAAPRALLGRVLEALNRPAEALGEYERFLALATRGEPQRPAVQQRVTALRGSASR